MTDKETLEQQPEEEPTEIPTEVAEEETAAAEAEAELMEEVAVAEEAARSAEIAALIEELAQARKSADEARDQALRTQAELQNFRRRKEREVSERIALANESLILELLPVLDDFERAFGAIPGEVREEHAAWIDGFDLIYRKLQKILENQGLTAIEAAGEFDPNVHEAVAMVPSEDTASGEVVQELRKGYKLKDKVVRASLVSVAQ
jgi:molecular chaperone GrpE